MAPCLLIPKLPTHTNHVPIGHLPAPMSHVPLSVTPVNAKDRAARRRYRGHLQSHAGLDRSARRGGCRWGRLTRVARSALTGMPPCPPKQHLQHAWPVARTAAEIFAKGA